MPNGSRPFEKAIEGRRCFPRRISFQIKRSVTVWPISPPSVQCRRSQARRCRNHKGEVRAFSKCRNMRRLMVGLARGGSPDRTDQKSHDELQDTSTREGTMKKRETYAETVGRGKGFRGR